MEMKEFSPSSPPSATSVLTAPFSWAAKAFFVGDAVNHRTRHRRRTETGGCQKDGSEEEEESRRRRGNRKVFSGEKFRDGGKEEGGGHGRDLIPGEEKSFFPSLWSSASSPAVSPPSSAVAAGGTDWLDFPPFPHSFSKRGGGRKTSRKGREIGDMGVGGHRAFPKGKQRVQSLLGDMGCREKQ